MAFRVLDSDAFTRGNNTDLGTEWDAGYTGRDQLRLNSNQARPGASITNQEGLETFNGTTPPSDQWASLIVPVFSSGAVYIAAGVMARWANAPTVSGFFAYIEKNAASAAFFELGEYIAGTFAQLASTSYTFNANDKLTIACEGTGIRALLNDVEQLSITDNSFASGKAGVYVYVATGGNNDQIALATFEVGDFIAAGTAGPVTGSGLVKSLVGGALAS